jgi:hypothetical protein
MLKLHSLLGQVTFALTVLLKESQQQSQTASSGLDWRMTFSGVAIMNYLIN